MSTAPHLSMGAQIHPATFMSMTCRPWPGLSVALAALSSGMHSLTGYSRVTACAILAGAYNIALWFVASLPHKPHVHVVLCLVQQ